MSDNPLTSKRQTHYEKNKDKYKKQFKEYYEQNKDKYKERYLNYYQNNKERINEYNRQYWKSYYISKKPYPLKKCDAIGMQIQTNVTVKFTF